MKSVALGCIALMALGTASVLGLDTVTPAPEPAWGTKDTITLTVAIIGAVTGVLGAVLGGINTWNAISARRLRVLVKPAHAIPVGGWGDPRVGFSIDVVNLSAFAVRVSEVGFTAKGGKIIITNPSVLDGGPWPRRLEPRDSVSLYFHPRDYLSPGTQIRKVYARLASGEIPTGTSPALRQIRDELTARD